MTMETDEQLVIRYLKGEEEALQLLIKRYLKPVYNFVYRYTARADSAEEITQDVFLSVWRNIKSFDLSRKFKTWLFAIAKNTSLNWLKKKRPLNFSQFDGEDGDNLFSESIADSSPLPDELFARADLADRLTEAMSKLSPDYRTVLLLHYHSGLTFQEIAESLDESINTIKSRHRRALVRLRELLVL